MNVKPSFNKSFAFYLQTYLSILNAIKGNSYNDKNQRNGFASQKMSFISDEIWKLICFPKDKPYSY